MKICVLLHFYQPHNQQEDILHRIVQECYIPLTDGLVKNNKAKVVININGALTELLYEKGYSEVLKNINILLKRNQVELTSSAKYHSFLPLLPKVESMRQVELNNKTNKTYFDTYNPKGFFSPEMAINDRVVKIASENGFTWVGAPQLAYPDPLGPGSERLYKDKDSGIYVMFRNKRVSSLILSGVCHDTNDLIKETADLHTTDKYWFVVMDAETFGHHRIGHDKFLIDMLNNDFFEPVTAAELIKSDLPVEETSIRSSTWTNEEQDFWLDKERTKSTEAKSFILWKDPENPIHKLQWELLNHVVKVVTEYENKSESKYKKARKMLDEAEASDQFWWASAKPWWSLEMIEQGAHQLKMVISTLSPKSQSMNKAEELYRKILDKAFEWQRTGYIRKRHLENSSTYMKESFKERTSPEWYNQIILEFEDEMKKASEKRDFEKAVKWRDAILKLRQGTDMYDVLHVVDELWSARNIPSVKPFLKHKWSEFSDFAKQNFENVTNEEEFLKWKSQKEKK